MPLGISQILQVLSLPNPHFYAFPFSSRNNITVLKGLAVSGHKTKVSG